MKIGIILTISIMMLTCNHTMKSKGGNYINATEEFDSADYSSYLDDYAYTMNVDNVYDAESAVKVAGKVWEEVYGYDEDIHEYQPYNVSYDSINGIWLVYGTFYNENYTVLGGEPYILIDQNAQRVLAVWHTE
jgi:hypothetical protein